VLCSISIARPPPLLSFMSMPSQFSRKEHSLDTVKCSHLARSFQLVGLDGRGGSRSSHDDHFHPMILPGVTFEVIPAVPDRMVTKDLVKLKTRITTGGFLSFGSFAKVLQKGRNRGMNQASTIVTASSPR
jgi:hypothetical protein